MYARDPRSHRRPAGWIDLPSIGSSPDWARPSDAPEVLSRAGQTAVEEFWRLWDSPMASQWDPVGDLALTVRVALMRAALARGDESGSKRLTELRACEDRLGLSALARERLRWRLHAAAPQGDPVSEVVFLSDTNRAE
ncbi:hypothetical protein FHR75_001278 [Kineococcus radiotolerans]|uniref:Uncharacterized protein n=1 Tax=Kineococcus radiotolerans TaxID=131568 RepID=A0A7W4TKE7_KINRA|nr:hypothetical protein [Kineococcus radiotolerans]